ncbi:CLUMA_CG001295, isoform A [Clunio marinus]|uniref:CLUMA_CG001295, isoform A n=1 Tax=Clunio marinus TaxID=568069 RepID=A0A1J1HM20_9DIPT|nr:CLUMA_CG001295, isoform A [Clunio marinus]
MEVNNDELFSAIKSLDSVINSEVFCSPANIMWLIKNEASIRHNIKFVKTADLSPLITNKESSMSASYQYQVEDN